MEVCCFLPMSLIDYRLTRTGNVFPAATLPYGMAKPGPDTDDPSNQGGFTFTNSHVTGFSQMHDSGTGGSPSLGVFPVRYCEFLVIWRAMLRLSTVIYASIMSG